MSPTFKECLDTKRIFPSRVKHLAKRELLVAGDDLRDARESLARKSYKWAIVQAYYSMFHAARALLYSQGYRERSHICLAAAIEDLFVKEKKLRASLLQGFRKTMSLRENADYAAEFSSEGAESSIGYAEDFLNNARELIPEKQA